MIIELKLQLQNNKMLFSAWELDDSIWDNREKSINYFLSKLFSLNNLKYEITKFNSNIIYNLNCSPVVFYEIKSNIDNYFSSIDGFVLVD